MGGILKNPLPRDQITKDETESSLSEFRKQVLKNTQLNAKLTNEANKKLQQQQFSALHGGPPKDTLTLKHEEEERLQWNQKNLSENEITKQQFADIHIDEPKTPYQGAVDPNGEYYHVDEEDEEYLRKVNGGDDIPPINDADDLENFTLGEPEFNMEETDNKDQSNTIEKNVSIVENNDENSDEEAAKHRRFEEMRKKHYDLKEVFKNRRIHEKDPVDEDDSDNNN
ncbi:hypothetical protein NCAS_0D02300 [Naumovozyma castellii]|uniref:Protein GLC8 n=1 Tax=Naumovozyma castellii TaxID=27288 RepID=G0VE20_NAUCA|nr:hypothetical protein NCAS_0D02300 [Naumovozyma castellii CBS 4309]CCC69811.1 hypothetical protein NCAS_0D02300 [Naumovozyma castellii CBS 4309]